MKIQYIKSQSAIPPDLIDTESSKKYVYIRKNVIEKQGYGVDGEEYAYYEYDESKLTKEQYEQYIAELSVADIQQQRADIDYIALMTGLDLEG